jgi:hypothetical protein
VDGWLVLGTDGVVPVGSAGGVSADERFTFDQLPGQLSGDLYDATYTLRAGAYSSSDNGLPYSLVQVKEIVSTVDPALLHRGAAEGWVAAPANLAKGLRAVHGVASDRKWAVGDGGVVLSHTGLAWQAQPSPTKKRLDGVWADSASSAFAVGEAGTILRFDGLKWVSEPSGTDKPLRAVWSPSPEDAVAVGWFTMLRRGDQGWEPIAGAPPRNLHAVWGSGPEDIWAMGAGGVALHWDGVVWEDVPLPTSETIRALWGHSSSLVVAVGDAGTALIFDGASWAPLAGVPVELGLRAVSGRTTGGALALWAVGEGGTILHFDGVAWTVEPPGGAVGELSGVFAAPDADEVVAVGSRALVLTPFMRVPEMAGPVVQSAPGAPFHLELDVDPGVAPRFRYGILSDTFGLPLWVLILDGDATSIELPDLDAIAGLTGIVPGQKRLTLYSVWKEGFDIDAYDHLDFRTSEWRSWSLTSLSFE